MRGPPSGRETERMNETAGVNGRKELASKLGAASQKADASLQVAATLLEHGNPGPSLVWSVRGVEIFLKEFVLVGAFLEEGSQSDWDRAVRKASKMFEALSWKRALKEIDERFGPLDPMETEDGRDALAVWEKEIVPDRHNIVHGRTDASEERATWVILYAKQLVTQLKLRLVTAEKHIFSEVFLGAIREAQDRYRHRQSDGE